MKAYSVLLLLSIIISACTTKSVEQKEGTGTNDSIITTIDEANDSQDSDNSEPQAESDLVTYFILIADTGLSYNLQHDKMVLLSKSMNLPIDTLGRYYNKEKNLIALPDDDQDEMYAGNYFPRRFASVSLSLEYLNYYQQNAGKKTIALVTGVYETKNSADSALAIVKNKANKAFVIKADIDLGDVH